MAETRQNTESSAGAEPDLVLRDRLGRPIRDLRISVTDRCNFRCRYCMPREHFGPGFQFLPRAEILSFEEIRRLASLFAELGVKKFRITGGEPLLRAELPKLIEMLSAIEGTEVALTTNGALLARDAAALATAGLSRLSVSLDSLDEPTFQAMNDTEYHAADVLRGIEAASRAGIGTIKVNCVVRRGTNESQILPLARHFKGTGQIVRFIEFMDVGLTNAWKLDDVVSGREIVERVSAELPLEPLEPTYRGEVARRFRYCDGGGEIGVITSVTQPFCGDCSRARVSAEGKLYTCLFSGFGTDLRALLRAGSSDAELREALSAVWRAREDRYSELRAKQPVRLRRVEMSYIGG